MVTPCRRTEARLRRRGADRRAGMRPSRPSQAVQHDGDVLAASAAHGLAQLLGDEMVDQGGTPPAGEPS